jgi:hypothetical protein
VVGDRVGESHHGVAIELTGKIEGGRGARSKRAFQKVQKAVQIAIADARPLLGLH